ncbi:unnamed protein product [Angiostrongylus costaricensis]|uniref:Aminoacyl-tRNA hydrolase n=1 Tax=Angiostrongylus costaricensis TaxID=334426 RepID=A0A0R3PMW3_ANGCS|nr:unnamed protein product [Angiostrongylus costaricensis]
MFVSGQRFYIFVFLRADDLSRCTQSLMSDCSKTIQTCSDYAVRTAVKKLHQEDDRLWTSTRITGSEEDEDVET